MKLMQRLGAVTDEQYVDEYIDMIVKNPDSCDDVWIATLYGYPGQGYHKKIR